MTGRDLRTLFSSNDRQLGASEAFTNRQAQWQVVQRALQEHQRRIAAASFEVDDLEAPRRNVLVFYGVGGIGKSTLSRKVEAALAGEPRPAEWTDPGWGDGRILPVRIDLARSAGTDVERVILSIRLALARIGRPLPAFDLALRRYWDHQHPGEPLDDYLRHRGLLSRFGAVLPEQMQAALGDVAQALLLPGSVGTAAGQVAAAAVRALREHRQSVRALAGCTRLADLLQAEPDLDALSYYPHLLAWEIAQLPEAKRVTPVVLFDTWEDTGDRTHRDVERLLQRIVWLMPNVLFVITGRSRLQWADPALHGQLDWTGPTAWPDLADHPFPHARGHAPAVPGQVLIGDFSSEDCDDYLSSRLNLGGHPLIGPAVRDAIIAHSHGLPLYLDLAVMRFLEIRRTGRTPQPEDFDVDFPALIARTLSDLTTDERHVLRAAALFMDFDLDLVTQAAGLTHQAPALRLVERPFISEDPLGLWPFHLHALIRSTIRTAEDHTDDRWSPGDWTTAAERALAALGTQWSAGDRADRLLLVGCLRQGLALARDFRLGLDWLAEAAWAYVNDSVWEPLAPPARADEADDPEAAGTGTAAGTLVELLSTLAGRQHEHRERTADRLTTIITSRLLPADLHEMAVYYLAKAERDLGRNDASRHSMQQVIDGGGRLVPAARRGLAHLARTAGDFPAALEAVQGLGWAGRQHRVEGDLYWPHGDMARAAAAYERARTDADQHGVSGERATSQTQLAFTLAFTDPARADDELDLAQQYLTGLDLHATTLTTQIAALLRDAGTPGIEDRARTLSTEINVAGLTAADVTLALALAFHHAVRGSSDAITACIAQLDEITRDGAYTYYSDIAHFMAALPLPHPSRTRWFDAEETVRSRWRRLVTGRREQLRAQ